MDSPRSGLRRAAAASWALTGIGIAGVAAASALAYADTLKPVATPSAELAVQPAAGDGATPAHDVEAPVVIATPFESPPPIAPAPPTTTASPMTPTPRVTKSAPPQGSEQQAPAVARKPATSTPAPKAAPAPTTTRRINTPKTVQSPKYSPPHIAVSRGS